jgi:hypothetical protein
VWCCPTCLDFCLLLNWFGLQECKQVKNDGKFYHFQHNTRAVKPEIVHFQLRNLVWATSKHDVYLMHSYSVMHWSALTRTSTEVLNVGGPIVAGSQVPSAAYPSKYGCIAR